MESVTHQPVILCHISFFLLLIVYSSRGEVIATQIQNYANIIITSKMIAY